MEAADNNRLFENHWKQAFEGASIAPPPAVWDRLEARLAIQKEKKYRKAVFLYRMMAAAMAAVALGLGAVVFFQQGKSREMSVATSAQLSAAPDNNGGGAEAMRAKEKASKDGDRQGDRLAAAYAQQEGAWAEQHAAAGGDEIKQRPTANGANIASLPVALALDEKGHMAVGELPLLVSCRAPLVTGVSPLSVSHIYGVPMPVKRRKMRLGNYPLVAGLGVGGGTFDPNYGSEQGGSSDYAFLATEQNSVYSKKGAAASGKFNEATGLVAPRSDRTASREDAYGRGGSFSFGLNAGRRIFKRMLLQAGVQYGRYTANGVSHLTLTDKAAGKNYVVNQATLPSQPVQKLLGTGNYSYGTRPVRITNTYQFVSVPLKLGVILLDGRTSVVLNTGVSGEFLLGNTVKAHGEGFEEVTAKAGGGSPYKNAYLNGLLGVEVNYALHDQYKILVEPYYSQAITPLTKNIEGLSSSPQIWGIQAGLRYEMR